ncbi:sensor histidine kinase [Maribacter sp. 2308TA10-17]|uniref:sensor histidine kinase n=1 Tax=Maribacter sp. 2308TA10-17 TaxID=3386276 RepID=UPI0039BCEEAA
MKNRIDKKLFGILLGYMAAYHVIYISRRVILKFMDESRFVDMDWSVVVFGPVLCNFLIIPPLIISILFVTKMMIRKNLSWYSSLGLHFVFSILYAFLVILLNTIYNYFVYGDPLELFSRAAFVNTLYGSTLNFLAYAGFVSIIYSYYYFQRISKAEIQKTQLAKQLQNVKMQALKSQLNPHFLFNTLNSISSLIEEDGYKAQHMIGNLGDLLREVLLVKDEDMLSVRREIIILNKYIEIMQTRFSDHLSVETNIDKAVEEALIPSMLLQPIMENSFEHGYSYVSTDLRVALSISKMDNWLKIQIQNNGTPIPVKGHNSGFGIRNVQERLETLFVDNFSFSFSNLKNGEGVITEMKIPLMIAQNDAV